MTAVNPEKLNQIAEEIVEMLGYQLFINDEEPENDPDRKKFRQLVQLIEMELSAELFVSTGSRPESEESVQSNREAEKAVSTLNQTKPAARIKHEAEVKENEFEPELRPEPEKKTNSTQIRLIHHQEEQASSFNAILRLFNSASGLCMLIVTIFLTGFITAMYLFDAKNSPFFNHGGHQADKTMAATPKDSKHQRAAKAFFMLGKSELEKKNYQAAREGFRMALSLEPDNPYYQEAFKQIELLSRNNKKKTRP